MTEKQNVELSFRASGCAVGEESRKLVPRDGEATPDEPTLHELVRSLAPPAVTPELEMTRAPSKRERFFQFSIFNFQFCLRGNRNTVPARKVLPVARVDTAATPVYLWQPFCGGNCCLKSGPVAQR